MGEMNTERLAECLVVAGPNGAGKTTFALDYLPERFSRNFVNADILA